MCFISFLLLIWPTVFFNEKKRPRCKIKLETSMIFIFWIISINHPEECTLCTNKIRLIYFYPNCDNFLPENVHFFSDFPPIPCAYDWNLHCSWELLLSYVKSYGLMANLKTNQIGVPWHGWWLVYIEALFKFFNTFMANICIVEKSHSY